MGRYLENRLETAILVALLAAGLMSPWATGAAALFFAACEIAAGLRRAPAPRWVPSAWPAVGTTMTVLYDSTCALCAGSKRRLESWRTASSLRFVAIQTPEAKALLPGIPEGQLLGAMHVIEDGRVTSGADGWFRIMRAAPLWMAWISWITPLFLARPVYRLIARNRYRWFGRVCEGGTCSIHPKR